MLQSGARVFLDVVRRSPVLIAFASTLLLSSCGSFDLFHSSAGAAPPASTAAAPQVAADDSFWPTHGWRNSSPEAQGIDSSVLAKALDTIRERHIPVNSLLIERHGSIVLDAYFYPYANDRAHDVASVTKSVTSTLVGIAISEHKLDRLDTPVAALLPDTPIAGDPRKAHITLAHLLSMTSGLDCSDADGRNFLQQMEHSSHWTSFALDRPQAAEPGSTFAYCAGNMHVVSAVLTRATGESTADYARAKLFAPLGIEQVSWPKDADGISHGFADLKLAPRDMAKLGYLWLHRGKWDGKQIVPEQYLAEALSPHANVEPDVQYGYGMWLYPQRGHAGGPADFEANGNGGQRIAVIPSQDVVEVITGTGLDANEVATLLAGAVKSDTPLPENPADGSALSMRVAEALSGSTGSIELAAVQPRPRPAVDVAMVSSAAGFDVQPKPRPAVDGALAPSAVGIAAADLSAATIAAVLPKPRPST
ncbi:MAG TPA: serine hydrolase [Rhizomicrobium sp.]